MSITVREFGKVDCKDVYLYTLKNKNGLTAEITNYGGIIVKLFTPDNEGNFDDVVLGFDNLDGYLQGCPYFGSLIGRHANRIEGAEFTINGVTYKLAKNDGENHLHGGEKGYDKVVWEPEVIKHSGTEALKLTYFSPHMEEGYPGNLDVTVIYSLTDDNELVLEYKAVSDKDTVVNLSNHSFFNLAGHKSVHDKDSKATLNDIYNHQLMINSDKFTVIDENIIPTGELRDVKNTPMDFTSLKTIGTGLNTDCEQLTFGKGYDHNWVLNNPNGLKDKIAEVFDPKTGRTMEVYTTKPGVQFYSGNFIEPVMGKGGVMYGKRCALCLETQYFPNGLKHEHFPSPILKAEETYAHKTIYKFGAR